MHYYRIKRALEGKPTRGGARPTRENLDMEDFWLFVKKHVIWDGDGHAIGLKTGLVMNWRGDDK